MLETAKKVALAVIPMMIAIILAALILEWREKKMTASAGAPAAGGDPAAGGTANGGAAPTTDGTVK